MRMRSVKNKDSLSRQKVGKTKSITKNIKKTVKRKIMGIKSKIVNNTSKEISESLSIDITEHISCREKEIKHLNAFFLQISKTKQNQFIYVSGCPGTGKTLVVKNLISKFQKKISSYFINCMNINTPNDFFHALLSKVNKSTQSSDPLKDLEKWMELKKQNKRILFVFDEVDRVSNYTIKIFNPIFRLLFQSKFFEFCIEHFFSFDSWQRYKHLIHPENVHNIIFLPYKSEQLQIIIKERLKKFPTVFSSDAIIYCAKTIASQGGDARKALSFLKIALNSQMNGNGLDKTPVINLPDIARLAENSINFTSSHICDGTSNFSIPQWLGFFSFLRLTSTHSNQKIYLKQIFDEYSKQSSQNNVNPLSSQDFKNVMEALEVYGLVKLNSNNCQDLTVYILI
ncbi:hypothetical protein HZS_5176 [Henneguya salminicola]|nr:hypothetical protein HZS_5176 [Henneguya salminicola]